jgi:hypothetical protein
VNGEVAKSIEASVRGSPHRAFPILKQTVDVIAGETIDRRKHISPSLMRMQQTVPPRSNPQTAVTVAQEPDWPNLTSVGKSVWLDFPVNELLDSHAQREPEVAVVAFDQSGNLR